MSVFEYFFLSSCLRINNKKYNWYKLLKSRAVKHIFAGYFSLRFDVTLNTNCFYIIKYFFNVNKFELEYVLRKNLLSVYDVIVWVSRFRKLKFF